MADRQNEHKFLALTARKFIKIGLNQEPLTYIIARKTFDLAELKY